MSNNIKHGHGMNGDVNLLHGAAVIERLRSDLVALQEVDRLCGRSGRIDQAAELGTLTDMHHAFGIFFDVDGGEYGMAILSKQPFQCVKSHRLPPSAEPRTSLVGHVTPLESSPEIAFANVHFYQTKQQRLDQASMLLELLKDKPLAFAP